MLDGVLSRVLSYRLFSHACYKLAVTPSCSGRCCHSCIREGWNLTITKTKLSKCSGKTPTYALPVIPGYRYPFRLNESHEIVDDKLYLNYDARVQAQWAEDIPGNIAKADENWPGVLTN